MAKIDYDVGDLVVCVDTGVIINHEQGIRHLGGNLLRLGGVYTVVGLGLTKRGAPAAQLAEVYGPDNGFYVRRFRKLPKKSQEFFAGETQTIRDLAPAE